MSGNNIISLGAEWWRYPREFWGSRDRETARKMYERPPDPVTQPLHTYALPGFGLHGNVSKQPQISAAADAVLAAYGIGKSRRTQKP